MRSYLVLVVGLLALLQPQALHAQPQALPAQLKPFPQNDAVKLRLEIEIRGMLSVTEKSATITHKETVFEWVEVEESRDPTGQRMPIDGPVLQMQPRVVDKAWVLDLDETLKKVAKALDGKEVVMIGKCLVLGVETRAESSKTPPTIRHRKVQQPRGLGPVELPEIAPEGIATAVAAQLRLDANVTVISLKAAK